MTTTNLYTGFLPYDLATWLFVDHIEVPVIFMISALLAAYLVITLYLNTLGTNVVSGEVIKCVKWFAGGVSISYGILITTCYIAWLM